MPYSILVIKVRYELIDFMQGWDGNLDRKECEQIVAPELAAEPIRSQAFHGVPLALPQRRFCVYQLEWDSSDEDLLPNVKFEDLLRNCERVEMVSARSDFGSVAMIARIGCGPISKQVTTIEMVAV